MVDVALTGLVRAVCLSAKHGLGKAPRERIRLLAGLGVEGDAHSGHTVRHRSRVKKDATRPNLRQVHLLHEELFEELRGGGFEVSAGQLGENITTRGLPLLTLPAGTRLHVGPAAVLELTGLRNPCKQLDGFQAGLMQAVLDRDDDDNLVRKAGVMAIVLTGGEVHCGDAIEAELPPEPHRPLAPV